MNTRVTFVSRYRSARLPKSILHGFFSLVGVNVLLAGLSFATSLVVANTLGRELFGDFSYSLAIGGYCLTIAYCGMEQTLVRDLVQSPLRFQKLVSASLLLRGGILFTAMIVMFGINFFSQSEGKMGPAGMAIVLAEGLKALYLAQVFDAWTATPRHALYLLVERSLYFAALWTVMFFFRDCLSIDTLAAIMVISTAAGFYLQYQWAVPKLSLRFDREIIGMALGLLKTNVWVWLAVLATLSFGTLSKIVLKQVSGSGQLGGYSVAWQVVPLGSLLISQICRIGNPRMAAILNPGIPRSSRIRFVIRYATLATLAGAAVGIPAILWPDTILKVFKPEYASIAGILRVFGVYVILIAIGQVATQYLISAKKDRIYSVVVMATGGLGMVLYAYCIPRWSGMGAAIAVVLSHGMAMLIYSTVVIRHILMHEDSPVSEHSVILFEAEA